MASPVTSIAEAEMGFVEGVTYWENALSYAPICVISQSLSEKKEHGIIL